MPEMVACPRCGFKVQMPEGLMGRRVRCFGCNESFLATPAPTPPPTPPPKPLPKKHPPPRRREEGDEEEAVPFCPSCGKRVSLDEESCPYCGENFQEEGEEARIRHIAAARRDWRPHRGLTISQLGNISLIFGCISLCLAGLGGLVSIPTGLAAWIMANGDLEKMNSGHVDPAGRLLTENGRSAGLMGAALGVLVAVGYVIVLLIWQ
jgi:predicted RNA-binding Zn-ribbon protein involved in translation (DUF1610 family)